MPIATAGLTGFLPRLGDFAPLTQALAEGKSPLALSGLAAVHRAYVAAGLRRPGAAEASLARLPLYEKMDTIKLDVTSLTPAETAEALFRLVRGGPKGEDHNAE